MSDRQEPTLADVMAAVVALGQKQTTGMTDLRADMTDLRADMTDLRADMKNMREVLMARMDRLQDTMTKQREDIGLLLDMSVENKSRADLAMTEARAAIDLQGSNSSAIQILQRKLMRLEDEVRELRNGK